MAVSKTDSEKDASRPGEPHRTIVEVSGWQSGMRARTWSPPTDVYETDDAYLVRVEIAGLRDRDFSVKLDKNRLMVSGTRSDEPGRRAYHQMEIRFGEFSSAILVPGPVDGDAAHAEYEDGFLTVTLPKIPAHGGAKD